MRRIPKANEIYRHFKGNLYRIVTLATHSETGETLVIYQALYGDYTVYARELSMFMSRVDREKYPDAQQEDRFALLTQIIGQETAKGAQESAATPEEQTRRQESAAIAEEQTRRQESAAIAEGQTRRQESAAREEHIQPPHETPAAPKTQEPPQKTADAGEEQAQLDPFLLQFLDADTYREKLNLLAALRSRITDDMINTMAVSLDVEINDGEIDDRYEALKTCLLTMERYECSRLR